MRELDPQTPPHSPACAVVGAGRLGTALAAALQTRPGRSSRGEPSRQARTSVLLCVPDGADRARRRPPSRPGPLVGHCSGATGLEPLGHREAFSLHPLMSVPSGSAPGRAAGRRRGRGRQHSARARAPRPRSPRPLGMRPAARRARGPRRLPRRRVDRRELPRHARGRRGAARRDGRDRARAARAARARRGRAMGRARRRAGADRSRSPAATSATVARQRAAVAERAPDLIAALGCARRRYSRARGGYQRPAMRTIRTIAEFRAHLARARASGRTIGLVPTMGAFHAGHHALIRAARDAHDERGRLAVRQPRSVQRAADLAAYPRDEAQAMPPRPQALGADVLFAPPVDEVYPPGFATTVHVAGLDRGRSRARSAAPGTSPASAPSWPSCSTSSRPTPPTSARRTRSRSPWSDGWCATSTSRSRIEVAAHRARPRRPRASCATPPRRRRARARPRAEPRPARRRGAGRGRRARRRRAARRPAAAGRRRRHARVLRARRPRDLRAAHDASTAGRARHRPRTSVPPA